MNISILTVFPALYDSFLKTSLIARAQENKLVTIDVASYFAQVNPKERIDAPAVGHGTGMVIRPEVVEKAIDAQEKKLGSAYKIFFSPQGKKLDQKVLRALQEKAQKAGHLMLVSARYEGIDARVEQEYADEIISAGDFVLMGGDIPAMLLLEGLMRLIPGVVGKQESIEHESFSGPFLDFPTYCQPNVWHDKEIPAVLKSGNHEALRVWRQNEAVEKTVLCHFDWLRSHDLTQQEVALAKEHMPAHYVALMHGQVERGDGHEGTTSVTSIDIHDIARSSKTYGIERFFIVTPLFDQQKIVRTLLDFWQTGVGIDYNPHRHEALSLVEIKDTLDDVIEAIKALHGVEPVVIATSARQGDKKLITYFDQSQVWACGRPVLLLFGTGRGLSQKVLERCDYILLPVKGFSDFNHLSVRSAAAIILDRWLGIQVKNS